MTTDSPGDWSALGTDLNQPLFQVGSTESRTVAVLHSLLLLLAAFVAGGLLGAGAGELLALAGLTEATAPAAVTIAETVGNFVGFLAVGIGYLALEDHISLVGLGRPSARDLVVIVGGFVLLILALTGLETLLAQLGIEPAQNSAVTAGEDNPELYLYFIPVVLFFNSPGEELLFRGLIQGRFRQAYGVVPGVVIASAVFGLIHYPALAGSGSELVYVGIAGVAGLVLRAAYEYTENLLVPVGIHAVWNVGTYLLLYAGAVGAL